MELTEQQETIIDRWLSAVETGKPDGDYGNVTVLSDNPHGGLQLTYGKHQTTEKGGKLKKLVKAYLDRKGRFVGRKVLESFAEAPLYSRVMDEQLKRLLRAAGEDPVMQDVQEEFFLYHYLKPAHDWADKNGFTLPLSMLVIYDSFIQSGGIPYWLRQRFREKPPAQGGDERKWIERYVETRHQWLKHWGNGLTEKSQAIRASAYRTRDLLKEIERDNWFLTLRPIVANGIPVAEGPSTGRKHKTCPTCGGSGKVKK